MDTYYNAKSCSSLHGKRNQVTQAWRNGQDSEIEWVFQVFEVKQLQSYGFQSHGLKDHGR